MRILIVEDDPGEGDTLRKILSDLGHRTQFVMDGETALVVAPKFQPHAVIIDIGLPGMQGHDLTRQIKALEGGENITIVVLSGWGREEDFERSRAVGVDCHLVKPLDLKLLKAALGRHPAASAD